MGTGGRMNDATTDKYVLKRVPTEKTPFELSDVKKAIPPHCFNRSLPTSFYYLLRDMIVCYTFYHLASNYIPLLPKPITYIAWPVYWFCQGCSFMGLHNLAHDMGHNSFSEYSWLDDVLGFVIHSSFLTPYFSFKYSHRSHHAHTNSIEYDEVATTAGAQWLFCIYGAPLLVMNGHFMFLTFLQHNHLGLAHYDSTEWDWIRGALSTVDRDYGILNKVFHDVTCAHVVHHLIPTIPHYHTVEVTKAIKPILGDYYKHDDTPVLKAFWREIKECIYVEPDEGAQRTGVYWFRR
ncbi:Fatty acid desaturase, type 1 [Cynara cardunculus var. scolymus]|uniref:Fatty acid desaturase, type 1 n=1 Tax=Cynara cardunculus var. scolymus TaxID=59895 RepID=A0A103Y8F1_CYNCS|nr:Fatty acid desaturase, type 1 [Cynara cardunculus var. scolymus]